MSQQRHRTSRMGQSPPRIRKKIGQPRSRAFRPASGQGCRAFSRTAGLLRRRKAILQCGAARGMRACEEMRYGDSRKLRC